eukprot:g5137.t1
MIEITHPWIHVHELLRTHRREMGYVDQIATECPRCRSPLEVDTFEQLNRERFSMGMAPRGQETYCVNDWCSYRTDTDGYELR